VESIQGHPWPGGGFRGDCSYGNLRLCLEAGMLHRGRKAACCKWIDVHHAQAEAWTQDIVYTRQRLHEELERFVQAGLGFNATVHVSKANDTLRFVFVIGSELSLSFDRLFKSTFH
jgi:hypothetical protein